MVLDPTLLFLKFSIFATFEKMKFNIPGIFHSDALRDLVPFTQLKNVENTHREVLLFVEFQALACNFTKSNTPP